MKKTILLLLVSIVAIALLATFSLTGCQEAEEAVEEAVEEAAEEVAEAAETAEEAAEEVAEEATEVAEEAEEMAEEEMAEDMDEPDPWIQEKRDLEKPFITDEIKFTGVEGEIPEYDLDLVLTKGQVAEIQAMGLKGAYIDNNTAGEYSLAIIGGARETFEYLNIEMVAETSADFDPAKQASDVETVLALDPDVVIGYPVDPTSGTAVFQPIVDAGIPLVCVSNRPKDYVLGEDFIGISTNNPYDNAYKIVEIMVEQLPEDATVGIVTYEDEYFVLNVMDQAFKDGVEALAPGWTIIEQGFVDWAGVGGIATAMVQTNPEIEAFYTTWFDPAMVAVQDLKSIERDDISVYTFGFNTPALIDLLDPEGMVKGLTSDFTWNVGMNSAIMCTYGVLGLEAPEMVVVPAVDVTPENVREVWSMAYRNVPIPAEVEEALADFGQ